MKKPEIQTTRHVDLLHACNYLEKNGFPGANNSIFDGEYNNDSMTSLPCFDGRDEFCEDPDDYEEKYVTYCNALWALYPNEDATLQWFVSW